MLCAAAKDRGDAVRATEPGAWIAFLDVDFTPAPKEAVICANTDQPGTLTLRIDNPISGPTVATADIPAATDHFDFTEVRIPVDSVTRRHDLYIVFEAAGTALAWIDLS